MFWILHIIFNFYELLILRTISMKFDEYLHFFRTSNLIFVASEIQILFLQWSTNSGGILAQVLF